MSGINQDIFDRQVDHAAMSRSFEDKVQIDTKRTIRKHRSRLTKIVQRLSFSTGSASKHMPEVKSEVNRFVKELDSGLTANVKDLGLVETDFTSNNLNKSLGKYAIVKRPKATQVLNEIVGANVRGDGNLSRRIQGLGSGELKRIQTAMQQGLREGW
jgi:hypothetical protein